MIATWNHPHRCTQKIKTTSQLERVVFHLDRSQSGSSELRGELQRLGEVQVVSWEAHLDDDPDGILKQSSDVVATGDSAILDAGPAWIDLARVVIDRQAGSAKCEPWRVDLSGVRHA